MNAEIVCVGTELLMGEVVNTDAAYIGECLARLGIDVYHHTVVGDNRKRLAECIVQAIGRSDIVIASGGLGPTPDDLTKEVISEVMECTLELHEESLERMKAYFKKSNRVMSESNIKQAMMPVGQIVLPNNYGTAPGCIIEKDGKRIIMLPGPPNELTRMFDESVKPYLEKLTEEKLYSRMYHIFGMGESRVAELLKDMMEKNSNPTVAPYAKTGEVHLRLCAKAKDEAEAEKIMSDADAVIREKIGEYIYSTDNKTLPETVVGLLIDKGLTVTAAESCTGGLFSKLITDVSGASSVLNESYVTYANESKVKIVGVNPETIKEYGVVSEEVAVQMAQGAAKTSGSDIGVGITGIAGPGGGTDKKPVGLVYMAVHYKGKTTTRELHLNGERERVRYVTCLNVFDEIKKII